LADEEVRLLAEAVNTTEDVVREVQAAHSGIVAAKAEAEQRLGSDFGGFWFDYTPSPTVTVAATARPSNADRDAISSSVATSIMVDFVSVKNGFGQLQEVAAAVLEEEFSGVVAVGVDVRRNEVGVGVEPEFYAQTESLLRERFPRAPLHIYSQEAPELVQLVGTCVARDACYPSARGGLEIWNLNRGTFCTSGFSATRGTASVMLTAGHCASKGHVVNHVSVPWGTMQVSLFGGDYDAGYFSQGSTWNPTNAVYFSDTTKWYTIKGVKLQSEEFVGEGLCRTGVTTNARCGQITAEFRTIETKDWKLTNQTITNICALGGDSGGPYIFAGNGYGMTSAAGGYSYDIGGRPHCASTSWSSYTPLSKVQTKLGVAVRVKAP
jgi:streptogrisin C